MSADMPELPDVIESEAQLDELLSRPDENLIEFMRALEGDILVLGAGGKVGPTLVSMAKRALVMAKTSRRIVAVGRRRLEGAAFEGVETRICDLLDLEAVRSLPQCENVVYMAGRKFGSTGSEALTWMLNVVAPEHVAASFPASRIAVFSTGCVYPLMDEDSGGASEETCPEPVGEYAMSCLGRERVFDHYSQTVGERVVHVRLNYAVECRYGVLFDVAKQVWDEVLVNVKTGRVNVIWQGDACRQILQCLALARSPSDVINITGPETISIPETAEKFGRLFGKRVFFKEKDQGVGYLSDASRAMKLFGPPQVPPDQIIEWVGRWIRRGGDDLGKPTHFETQDGKY